MKIFERITFPSSAIYNISPEIGAKTTGCADVSVCKTEVKITYVDVSDFTYEEAEIVIESCKQTLKSKQVV